MYSTEWTEIQKRKKENILLQHITYWKNIECYEKYNWKIKKSTNLPCKLIINKVDVYNKPEIANAFNDFFSIG